MVSLVTFPQTDDPSLDEDLIGCFVCTALYCLPLSNVDLFYFNHVGYFILSLDILASCMDHLYPVTSYTKV